MASSSLWQVDFNAFNILQIIFTAQAVSLGLSLWSHIYLKCAHFSLSLWACLCDPDSWSEDSWPCAMCDWLLRVALIPRQRNSRLIEYNAGFIRLVLKLDLYKNLRQWEHITVCKGKLALVFLRDLEDDKATTLIKKKKLYSISILISNLKNK